ncbi:MAG: S-layer homology domain-containing protein [Marinisporobacter sp.]|jgi:hypothetical protein|nr:S-layer homology domain-containing protein [Marinisporobacter sp.]
MNELKSIVMKRIGLLVVIALVFCMPMAVFASGTMVSIMVSEKNGRVPGKVRVNLDNKFSNTSIVNISGQGIKTSAVVGEGMIEFDAKKYGEYVIKDTKKSTRDYFTESMRTKDMSVGAYKGIGSTEDPYTLISTFADVPMELYKLQAAWKGYNYLAGYPTMDSKKDSDYLKSFDKSHVLALLVEDRDENTGRLRGSFFIDGSLWLHVTGNNKGPYYMNYMLDPTDTYLTSGYALDNHYLYSDNIPNGAERKKEAIKKIKAVRNSTTSALFFNYRMRDFSGPIVFTVDVSESGKFKPGDVVSVHYLLGSSDRNLFHGIKPEPDTLIKQEPTFRKHYQDKGMTVTVDDNGYLSLPLYNGGYFELKNETSIKEKRLVKVAPKMYKTAEIVDVDSSNLAYDSICLLVGKNYMSAEGGRFKPDEIINRGEFLKGLLLSSGITIHSGDIEFTDVPKKSMWNDYVFTAVEEGITKGVSEDVFGIDKKVNREMATVFICNALNMEPGTDDFTDADDISSWAVGYPGACKSAGYIEEYSDGRFGAKDDLTRAEAAVIFNKIYESKH